MLAHAHHTVSLSRSGAPSPSAVYVICYHHSRRPLRHQLLLLPPPPLFYRRASSRSLSVSTPNADTAARPVRRNASRDTRVHTMALRLLLAVFTTHVRILSLTPPPLCHLFTDTELFISRFWISLQVVCSIILITPFLMS